MGNIIWAKSAGGTGNDFSNGITTDASGNIYMTGSFGSSSITFGSNILINAGVNYSDIFIVKYDSSGNVLWAKREGESYGDASNGIPTG